MHTHAHITHFPCQNTNIFITSFHNNIFRYRGQFFDAVVAAVQARKGKSARHLQDLPLAGGKCYGSHPELRAQMGTGWATNSQLREKFRFIVSFENSDSRGFLTEKMLNAFLVGSVPIYAGTDEVLEIFNPKAFVFLRNVRLNTL